MVETMFSARFKSKYSLVEVQTIQVGLLLTLDVEEDGLALDDVGVGGDAVADAAAVVAARRLLHALQHQHAGVVHRGQHQAGARVRVHPVLLQHLALKGKK